MGGNLCSCVKALVLACFGEGLSAEDLLAIMSQRGCNVRDAGANANHKALLEADGAGLPLLQSDQMLSVDMQEEANFVDPEMKVFDSCLGGLRSQVRRGVPGGASTPRLGRSAGAAPRPPRVGNRHDRADRWAPSSFTRIRLRELLPPNFGAGHGSIQKRWGA